MIKYESYWGKNMVITQIPFTINNINGHIEIKYEKNKSAAQSGFDILKGLNFDVGMCVGYPTIHGYIKDFKATGYKRYCGWIQILELKYFSLSTSIKPDKVIVTVDSSPIINTPFFAYGYPAEIYDAPCNNLGDNFKLQWIANTYLVSVPSPANDNSITFLAGFKWGYDEWAGEDNERQVEIHPLVQLERSKWEHDIEILRCEFPYLNYQ